MAVVKGKPNFSIGSMSTKKSSKNSVGSSKGITKGYSEKKMSAKGGKKR